MSHTIYAAKFEQTIIPQHVPLRRENQLHAPAHVIMRIYQIDKSLVFIKRKKDVMLELLLNYPLTFNKLKYLQLFTINV